MTQKQLSFLSVLLLASLALTAGWIGRHHLQPTVPLPATTESIAADQDKSITSPEPAAAASMEEHSAGRRVYVDPKTGRPSSVPPSGPPGLSRLPEVANPLSTSSDGLREVPVATPGGGVMVDLQGRFRNMVTATVRADGTVGLRCGPGLEGCSEVDCSAPGHKTSVDNPPVQPGKHNP